MQFVVNITDAQLSLFLQVLAQFFTLPQPQIAVLARSRRLLQTATTIRFTLTSLAELLAFQQLLASPTFLQDLNRLLTLYGLGTTIQVTALGTDTPSQNAVLSSPVGMGVYLGAAGGVVGAAALGGLIWYLATPKKPPVQKDKIKVPDHWKKAP